MQPTEVDLNNFLVSNNRLKTISSNLHDIWLNNLRDIDNHKQCDETILQSKTPNSLCMF